MILDEYFPIFVMLIIAIILAVVMYLGSYIIAFQNPDIEKISPYECGFDPFEDARHKFQVKFYLVGILFLIFDLEVVFLFPWSISLINIDIIFIFLIILTIGFVYEWKKGALDW